ncbi:MAG TPA: hypothetical protein DCQ31_16370, partial [Bacteroidales bacterium]|nr:hypothetical protein [Bacteroidales bacterium]
TEIKTLQIWSRILAGLLSHFSIEKKLEQAHLNYETFFNTIDDFIYVFDDFGRLIHTNNSVITRLGYTKLQLAKLTVFSLFPKNKQNEIFRLFGANKISDEVLTIPLVNKFGHHIPVETKFKQGFWNGIAVFFGISKDISEILISKQKFASAF